ncbi:MAG: helix-turn-helix domain-containing protein, partial [Pseudobdellovibrionaceae bacterium]
LPEVNFATGVMEAVSEKIGLKATSEDDEDLDSDSGDEDLIEEGSEPMAAVTGESLDFNAQKEAFEKEFIIKALKTFKGRINQTALHANIPKKTLLRKIEKYGIVAKDYTAGL